MATAESCTGGWVAEAITMVPGSSAWFDRGFVTYTNVSKREMLGVRAETLDERGAGSTEVTYRLAVDIAIPMIGMLKRKAEKLITDTALKELKKRVES